MTDNIAPVHHQTTMDATTGGITGSEHSHSAVAAPTFRNQDDTIAQQSSVTADSSTPEGNSRDRLSSVHEPRTSLGSDASAPLASTEGPFHQPTTDEISKKETPLTSSVSSQNAPGRAGSVGEAALSAFGYGGSHVERPKEEQGIGEKIVNFLGA